MAPRHTLISTQLGELTLIADEDCLTGVYFEHHWYPPTADALGSYVNTVEDETLAQAARELTDYVQGLRTSFTVATRTSGDAFSEDVWDRLKAIPYGATTTYGSIAKAMGDVALAQRVGQAVGHNPISIVIPCHRVVGADGSLTGYAGGVARKAFLLDLETPAEVAASRLF